MRQIPKLAGLLLAAAVALTGCGSTGDGAPTSATNQNTAQQTSGETTAPQGQATVTYAPEEVVKPKDGKKLKIGVSFPVLDQFLQTVADGMQKRATEAGVELVVVAAQEKTDVQLGQIENFVSQGLDGIIVIPVDTDATEPITTKVTAAKIPLTYVNRRPAALPSGVTYVGSNSLIAGQLQMEALVKLAGEKGNVAILIGDPANEAAQLRTKGCKEIVAKYPNMKVIREQAGTWQRDKGLSITENWIQSGDQIDIICANNDEMALGAIQALKNANKLDKVLVGGVDATADALVAMKAGDLEVTVFQDAKGQGAGGVDTIIKMHNGDTVPSVIDVPYQLVTPENMAKFQ